MNALKLLFCGNSLAAGQDVVGRFRMREDQLLPRFGGEAADGPATTAAIEDRSWWQQLRTIFFRGRINPKPFAGDAITQPAVNAAVGVVDADHTQAIVTDQEEITWKPKLFRTQPRDAKAVQGEFRFEKVKVVCNDLHDADFEIISAPRQSRPLPASAGSREPALCVSDR